MWMLPVVLPLCLERRVFPLCRRCSAVDGSAGLLALLPL